MLKHDLRSRFNRAGVIRPRAGIGMILFLLLAAVAFWWWDYDPTDSTYGRFDGAITVTWDDDGRNMRLERDFAYIDGANLRWPAPSGSVINGASIPRLFWSVIGGPFEGKFRNASVVHDAAVEAQTEPWEKVHRMFYDALRCSRVGEGKAQTMYWAVYHFGPRWHVVEEVHKGASGQEETVTQVVEEQPAQPPEEIVAKAERYFNRQRLTPKEIEECTVEDIENEVAKWDAKEAENAK